ncbi:MAG: GGDEF domain-containing protein [Chloroflexi bacterium]|nr:GGDEF domain-containing protein [Chloroflexota bacterium]
MAASVIASAWRLIARAARAWQIGLVVAGLLALPAAALLLDDVRSMVSTAPQIWVGVVITLAIVGFAIGAAIARLIARLRDEIFTDGLTGLYNRRFMDAQLVLIDSGAGRYGRHYAVLAFDLDGLKEVNDAHGHETGDLAIRAFAEALRGVLRRSDVAIRRGGDEFIAILPETPVSDARVVFARVRARLGEAREREPRLAVTVSAGAVAWRPGRSIAALVRAADELLYDAKRSGGDRLELERAA